MNFIKYFLCGLCACACAMSFAFASNHSPNAKTPSKRAFRRDVPWVSLERQRSLDANGRPVVELSKEKPKEDKSLLGQFVKDSMPKLSADKFTYAADDSGDMVAKGNAVVSDKNFHIEAETVEYFRKKGAIKVSENARLALEPARMLSESIFVDITKDSFDSGYSRYGMYPIFVESASVKADKKKFVSEDSITYFNEPSFASLSASSGKVSYDMESELLELEDVTLRVGDVPFFYVPYYSQHGLKRPPIDVKMAVGYNDDYGAFTRNDIMYTGFGDVSVGVLLDYYSKRSVLAGPKVEYSHRGVETWLEGWAQGAYINDNANTSILGVDSRGKAIDKERFFIELRHAQMVSENLGIVSNISWWSDEFVTRDFRPDLFYENQTPDNFAEVNYYGGAYTASLFTRFAPNNWELVQQRLPEIRFDGHPYELFGTGAYQQTFLSYAYLREFDPNGIRDYIDNNRVDAYYGISRPIQLTSWSKFTPVIGGRVTYYANATSGSSDYVRMLGQIGFDAQMDIWGQWETKNEAMGIDGIRHHIMPTISYRYIPSASQGAGRIPQIDDYYFTNYPQPLDLSTMRNVDMLTDFSTMRFGLQNVFETRDPVYGSREIARLDIYQDVNFTKQPLIQSNGMESFSDFYVNASVSPARWLTIGSYSRYNTNHFDLDEIDNYIKFMDGDEWEAYLIQAYFRNSVIQYGAQLRYRISENYRVYGRWYYDYKTSTFTDQTYGLSMRIGNIWIIDYYLSYRSDSRRQNGASFGVRATMAIY